MRSWSKLPERARSSSSATIPRAAEGEPGPLSFAQDCCGVSSSGIRTSAYNVPRAMQVLGPLASRDYRALDRLVARQRSCARCSSAMATSRLSSAAARRRVERSAVVRTTPIASSGAGDGAVRSREGSAAATLVRIAPEHVLLLLSHHIASDGSSGGLMLRDLDALYRGDDDTLAPLAIQYPDFAARAYAHRRASELLWYWRTKLSGAPARLELPTDRPRPLAPSFGGARRTWCNNVARPCTARHASATTPFVVLLAAFDVCCIAIRDRTTSSSAQL